VRFCIGLSVSLSLIRKGDVIAAAGVAKIPQPGSVDQCMLQPSPSGEDTRDAAIRRLREELGFSTNLEKVFHFTYRSDFENGLTEFEFDHVFVGTMMRPSTPTRLRSVIIVHWSPAMIQKSLRLQPDRFTSWFRLAFPLLGEKINTW